MKSLLTFILLLTATCRIGLGQENAARFWKVDDVRVGMKGIGKTVLKGNEIEEFQFEVIGIVRKVFPGQDLFLARLSGLGLEDTGVIEGMSGSPLYIEGKLLGAVAYGWIFSKQPIAGITPAEQMFNLIAAADKPKPDAAREKNQGLWKPRRKGAALAKRHVPGEAGATEPTALAHAAFTRLRAPLIISGCPQPVFSRFAKRFEQMGLLPVQGGGAGNNDDEGADAAALLRPGAPVAVTFIDGDMTMAGIGTVTERVGDGVLAFGHPMMEMGRTELPMSTAEVNAVVPSLLSSFKLGSVGKTVGTILVDRVEGVYGRIGEPPPMVPVTITVNREDMPGKATYNFRVADNYELTPMLVDICLFSSLFMKGYPPPQHTLQYKVTVVTDKGDVIRLEGITTSQTWWSLWTFFDAVTGTVSSLMYNPFQPVRIKQVTAEVDIKNGDRTAVIHSVRLLDVKVAPGKPARVRVELRPYRKPAATIDIEILIPEDLPEGVYSVEITDADGALQAEANAAPPEFDPSNYSELLKLLRRQYPANKIYALIALPHTGLAVRGTPLRNLPASYLSMLTPLGRGRIELIGTVLKSSKPTPYHVVGSQNVQLVVEKED